MEAGVETAATAAAISLPDLEAVALGLDTLRHNLPVSGQLKDLWHKIINCLTWRLSPLGWTLSGTTSPSQVS